jgi:hypothetical protein
MIVKNILSLKFRLLVRSAGQFLEKRGDMKTKKWRSLLLYSFIVTAMLASALMVSGVQARPINPSEGLNPSPADEESKESAHAYNPAEFQQTWGATPDMLIDCDPSGDLLSKVSAGSVKTYHALQASACRQQAAETQLLASIDFNSAASGGNGGCGVGGNSGCKTGYTGVSGEGKNLKISPPITETRYVYLQCGKKVGVFGPPSCSCSGNYHYTYSCQKPQTVYITIPCFH